MLPAAVGPAVRRLALAAALLAAGAASSGCSRHAKSPDDAYRRFAAAVRAKDGAALFESLDQATRWSWMSVQKAHREAYDIILSNYPEGAAREKELRRFEAGATTTSAVELFQQDVAPGALPMLAALAAADAPRIDVQGERADAVLPSAARVPFRKGSDGTWGFAGLAAEAEERKIRAIQDLELVRTSGADYERAAARSGR
jgi:hypothetical protein